MLEKLFYRPLAVLSQIRHIRIHLAYLDLDVTSEAHKQRNKRYPYEVDEYELPSAFQLLTGLRLVTITVLGWEFKFYENLDSIFEFFMDDSHWKELRFITPPRAGSMNPFEVRSDIPDRGLDSERALSEFELKIGEWSEYLQERSLKVGIYHSSAVEPHKRVVLDQLSGTRVNLHGLTDRASREGHDIDKVMVVVKRDNPDRLQKLDGPEFRRVSIQDLNKDRSWGRVRVPPRYFWPKDHAAQEEIDTYRCVDDITGTPKDFDNPYRNEWSKVP